MIEGGIFVFLVGVLIAFGSAVERAAVHRRWVHSEMTVPTLPLKAAFPIVAPSPTLDALVADAETAIDADDLMRGVVAIGAVYTLPARDLPSSTEQQP